MIIGTHYQIAPGFADEPQEFGFLLCAQRFRDAREEVAATMAVLRQAPAGWHQQLTPGFLAEAKAEVQALRETCRTIETGLEQAYLQASRYQEEQWAEQGRRLDRVADFKRRVIYLGSDEVPQLHDHLGWVQDNPAWPVSLSRDSGHLIVGAGAQGSGKTQMSTVMCESILEPEEPLASSQPRLPTAYIFFHLEEQDRLPQLLDALKPNPKQEDLDLLLSRLGVKGRGIRHVRFAVPESLYEELASRLKPYQDLGLQVRLLKVQLAEMGQPGLEGALGAEDGTQCVKRMLEYAQRQGKHLDIAGMREFIDQAPDLNATQKAMARARLAWLEEIASPPDGPGIWDLFEPGVATVVYLGGPYVGQGRVLPILIGLLNGLMLQSERHGEFQRVIVVDEVNLLARADAAWKAFIRVGRMVRHRGSTLMLLGQDLNCVPDELFGLASLCFVFMLRNPKILEYIRERYGPLGGILWEQVKDLKPGEAVVGMSQCTQAHLRQAAITMKMRPPRCMHGGYTRAAV